jgi:hypothetical protein
MLYFEKPIIVDDGNVLECWMILWFNAKLLDQNKYVSPDSMEQYATCELIGWKSNEDRKNGVKPSAYTVHLKERGIEDNSAYDSVRQALISFILGSDLFDGAFVKDSETGENLK